MSAGRVRTYLGFPRNVPVKPTEVAALIEDRLSACYVFTGSFTTEKEDPEVGEGLADAFDNESQTNGQSEPDPEA